MAGITYSIILKSQLEGAKRLDAEYYQPEYLEIDSAMKQHQPLKIFAEKIFSGPFGSTLKSESYQDAGIPFIRIGDISDLFIETMGLVYISESEHRRIHSTYLKPGDIVLSKIGTVGRLSVIPEELGEVNISENNIGLRLSNLSHAQKVFLLVFLLGRFGQRQLKRKASGNIQLKLNVSDVEEIKIPTVPPSVHTQICQMYDQAVEQIHRSNVLYSQAEKVLLKDLELEDFEEDGEPWSIVQLSEIKAAHRVDAEYFQPKYEKLKEKLGQYGAKPMSEIVQNVAATFVPQTDKKYRYIELANINASIGVIDGFTEVSGKEAPSRARRLLKAGDAIVSSVQGSLGKVALVGKEHAGDIASTGGFQFRSTYVLPEVLLVLAKSIILQFQMEQRCAGTILTAVPKGSIEDILIPVLPETTQQQIAALVRASHAARARARELLEQAKRTVEECVERGVVAR